MGDVFPLIQECFAGSPPEPTETDSLSLRLVVEGDEESGAVVTESEVQGLDARRQDLAACVSESLYAARFEPPARAGSLTLELSFNPRHPPEGD